MNPKPLPIIIAVAILVIAGGGLWYVLTRPSPALPPTGTATSTPQGVEGPKETLRNAGQYHEITATYPSATALRATAGTEADAAAVASLKFFAEQESSRFKENNVDVLTEQDIQIFGLSGDRKYVLDMDYDAYQSPDTVSYVYHMYADTLGAHPNAYYRTFTFDKKTGEGLHLDDLFTGDYLNILSIKSRAYLTPILGEGDMLEAGTTPFADNFQNFYLTGNEFVLVFPPYQVGPWAVGTQEVRIPRSELSGVLQAEYR